MGTWDKKNIKYNNLNIIMIKRVSAELQLHSTANMDDFAPVFSEMEW